MDDNRGQVLPVYVAVDESASMTPYIGELEAGLETLYETLLREPMAAAKVRFAILGFASDVVQRLTLTDLRELDALPRLVGRGATSYAALFRTLVEQIPADVTALKAQGYRVFRPCLFLMSDGQPNYGDDWEVQYVRLTDPAIVRAAPNIIACGIGDAHAETILALATRAEFAFMSRADTDIGQAVAQFFAALTSSVVASGRSMSSGNAELVVERPEGFRLAIDLI